MIHVITSSSSGSSRMMVQFLKDNGLSFEEQNITKMHLTIGQVMYLASRAGTIYDIIAIKSKAYKELEVLLEAEDTTLFDVYRYMADHPTVVRTPITYDEKRFVIGYGEDIAEFVPRSERTRQMTGALNILWQDDIAAKNQMPYEEHEEVII